MLQRAILGPARLPAGFAARYEPASRPLEVGGDWFDIVELPDGRTGIVVGDCVGHGLDAATVMGQLRSACRAILLQDASPAQTLSALDRFAAQIPRAVCSTVFCGILDAAAGRLTYSSAGHPPGILARPDGRIQLLGGGASPVEELASELMATMAPLGDALDQAGTGPVVVDLTAVGYLDSAGLTVLFAHAGHIELIVTELLAPVLTISGLAEITRVSASPS